jgi:hypothetical protein
MHIGVDFDNTIVCYDGVFHRAAVERGLIPATVHASKSGVRDYLRLLGREDAWIELQGYVYGARMEDADPYPGVFEFFSACRERGIPIHVISHKTLRPFQGPQYDLHEAAHRWLRKYGFFEPEQLGLAAETVIFELTKQAKLESIRRVGCTHFIDDLPEFLSEPAFPPEVQRILFDPTGLYAESAFLRTCSWEDLHRMLLGRP